jgi:heterodisulfide reductase subunit A2
MQKDVLILGGGVAGLNVALDLASSGYPVHLVTPEPGLGGQFINTDNSASDTPQSCIWGDQVNISALYLGGNIHASTTILGSLISRTVNNPHIRIYLSAKLSKLSGDAGNFRAALQTANGNKELHVGAVIVAVGFSLYDATSKGEYGYGEYPSVMTSLEYENLLFNSACRQYGLQRTHDKKPVKKVGFIQCVGSRDIANNAEYCSSLCCMFTTKEAILTKELYPETDATVYYLDLRSCGKNFDQFVAHAKDLGTKYVRTMISEVKENPQTEDVSIHYIGETGLTQDDFDLIVLATGIRPSKELATLTNTLNLKLDKYGFINSHPLQPVLTDQPGIFAVTGTQGPMDVPETMALASSASAAVAKFLGSVEVSAKRPMVEHVLAASPSVAVFLCRAGLQTLGADEKQVIDYVRNLPGVVAVEADSRTCNPEVFDHVKEVVKAKSADRIVVGPCPLRANQFVFQEMAQKAGINRFLVEQATYPANTVTQNVLEGTEQTAEMLRRSVTLVKTHRPLYLQPSPVIKKALVIGGGVSGMITALEIAEKGLSVCLSEKEQQLGGYAQRLFKTVEGHDIQHLVNELKDKVLNNPLVEVLTGVEILESSGHQGHFITTVACGDGPLKQIRKIDHGVTIIASGTKEFLPHDVYLYGKNDRIITNTELEYRFVNGWNSSGQGNYVFVQCAGSRNELRPYCGRTCCTQTITNATAIKTQNPDAQVYVLFRDMRTPGYLEQYYKDAREKGVIFIPYEENAKPIISLQNGTLTVAIVDPISGMAMTLTPKLLVLATARIPSPDTRCLADLFHLQMDEEGFLSETHSSFGPIGFPGGGIFVTGTAHAPKSIADCITQAQGVAGRASRILNQPHVLLGGIVACVDQEKCAACLTCVRTCPFGVPQINRDTKEMGAAVIMAEDCRGCGICTGECPNKAIELKHYEDEQMLNRIVGLMTEVS